MKRAVIVHCWEGYPEYCWYPWAKRELEKRGFEVQVPAMPDTDRPQMEKWISHLAQAIGEPDEELWLIGHSIGAVTVMRYLETLPANPQPGASGPGGKKIAGAVLVAGFTDDLGYTELANFFPQPLDYARIRGAVAGRIALIQSDNDPFVPRRHGDILADELGARLIVKHAAGHFSGEDHCTELPEVVGVIDDRRRAAQL